MEADALTNGHFAGVDPDRRIHVDVRTLKWVVLLDMLRAGEGMLEELQALRDQREAERAAARERKKARKKLAGGGLKVSAPW